ncbi:MAG: GDP-mannose 4,6-dehydratase [Clostridiales bacterium]|jgi:UDP-glucose 4-epimerase|nr:GDP-mannose 4,6-dehydratase [Clostridiales bacterium]
MRGLNGKNVLITGGAGFIGSHLAEPVLEAGAAKLVILDNFFVGKMGNLSAVKDKTNVIVYREDASDLHAVEAVVRNEHIQVVYNMATMALNYSFFNPHTACMVNIRIADTLLHLLRNGEFESLIHMSSSEAYGTALYAPMDENHPLNPTTPYAAGKASADLMVKSFCNLYNLDAIIIRPFNNYGPRQNIDGGLAGIIPVTVRRVLAGEKPVVEGGGLQTRDYIYVSDTCRALISAYGHDGLGGEIINLGSGTEYKIIDIINYICSYIGYKGEIEFREGRPADVKRLCASSEKAKNLLGFEAEISFEEGMAKTLDWYLSGYH